MALPWELEQWIAIEACASLKDILLMRSVCKRWRRLANKIHRAKVSEIHCEILALSYEEKPLGKLFSKLLMQATYRSAKVDAWLDKQKHGFLTKKFTEDLQGEESKLDVITSDNLLTVFSKDNYSIIISPTVIRVVNNSMDTIPPEKYSEVLGISLERMRELNEKCRSKRSQCFNIDLGLKDGLSRI